MARHKAGIPPSTDRPQGCWPIAATASWTRRRRWLPEATGRAALVRVRSAASVAFPLPHTAGLHAAGPVRCPAAWELHLQQQLPCTWTLTLISATALGEGYHQVHARCDDGTALRTVTGLARLVARDAVTWILTAELETDHAPDRGSPDRIRLSALLLQPDVSDQAGDS